MVENTMNYYIFVYQWFMKVSRLYSTFLVKCNLRGIYFPNKYIPHHIKFFRKKTPFMSISTCTSNLNVSSNGNNNPCEEYCSMFNPVTYH